LDPGAASPPSAGLDPAALAQLLSALDDRIARSRIPGAVAMIVRRGALGCFEALGRQDPTRGSPMRRDSIFRIYSMTKPIVSLAAMRLVEQGRLRLNQPVSAYLAEFMSTPLGIERDGRLELAAPARAPTIHDLLRHTSGLTYEFLASSLVAKQYQAAGIDSLERSNVELAKALATLPLMHEPGTVWDYSRSTDVLGRVIEVIADRPLGDHLRETVFEPLGMTDTGFHVPPQHHDRIAEPFACDPDGGNAVALLEPRAASVSQSGGGGLMSTAADYARFLAMMLAGGTLDGIRLLGHKTVEFMTADHLGTIPAIGDALPPGHGFGLGFAVRLETGVAPVPGSVGTYSWGGIAGTSFFVDPKEQMFALLLTQAPAQRDELRSVFRAGVYAALERS
jgi:CubicO group peptidase (beta-lactamase class C family)